MKSRSPVLATSKLTEDQLNEVRTTIFRLFNALSSRKITELQMTLHISFDNYKLVVALSSSTKKMHHRTFNTATRIGRVTLRYDIMPNPSIIVASVRNELDEDLAHKLERFLSSTVFRVDRKDWGCQRARVGFFANPTDRQLKKVVDSVTADFIGQL